ncbi:MAG: hypothetical protein ACR2FG_11485 [Marmoricola sp.]
MPCPEELAALWRDEIRRLHDPTFLPDGRYVAVAADALVAGYCAALGDET